MFTWIVTGAAGHLGGTIVRLLQERKAEVRGLVLPHESAADQGETRYFTGDVTLPETLVPLFEGTDQDVYKRQANRFVASYATIIMICRIIVNLSCSNVLTIYSKEYIINTKRM